MDAPRGYRLEKRLYAGADVDVCSALRLADGMRVFLHAFRGDRPRVETRAAFELAQRLGAATLRPLELHELHEPPLFVSEACDGALLESALQTGPPTLEAFLALAVDLVEAVEALHALRIVHRDLSPGRIWLAEGRPGRVLLLDLSMCLPLGKAQKASHRIAGTLAYVSPEQTGRMARGVDLRSDLYMLGATFYHVLAGEPPFLSKDPLELVHAHLARRPRPLTELRRDCPAVLARMVHRLLEKEPDNRYQSARSLATDLASCRAALEEHGAIPPELPLGGADAPARPLFRRRLYGREAQAHDLCDAYARVVAGRGNEVLVIRGPAGMGKSSLREELREALARTRGYLAHGKFDLDRSTAYSAVQRAFQALVEQMLTEPTNHIERWRGELREALGNVAQVLVDLVPDLSHLLGEVAPVPRLGPEETRQRLALACGRFLAAMARAQHPLVLFLDDVQWADLGSVYLLEQSLLAGECEALLVIATCREGEPTSDDPIGPALARLQARGVPVREIELQPLSAPACAEMLSEALGRTLADVQWLAERVQLKTGNSPFLIQQFILRMQEQGAIRFEQGSNWVWNEEEIAAADVLDDAIEPLTAKLSTLPESHRELLRIASCVGSTPDPEQLARIARTPLASIEIALHALADAGLVCPCREGYRFAHDRVREAALNLSSPAERERLHYEIGWSLFDAGGGAILPETASGICDHLNRAHALLQREQRVPLLGLNVAAGRRMLSIGAWHRARCYLDAGVSLFEMDDWVRDPQLAFDLHYQRMESARLCQDHAEALRQIAELEQRPLPTIQATFVTFRKVTIHALLDPKEAVRIALIELAHLGVGFSTDPGPLRLRFDQWRTDRMLRRRPDAELLVKATQLPEKWISAFLLMSGAAGAMIRLNTRLTLLLVAWIVRRYAQLGYYRAPDFALGGYAHLRLVVAPDHDLSKRYGEAALRFMQTTADPVLMPRAAVQIHGVLQPWFLPRRAVLEDLRRTFEAALEVGDNEYAFYAKYLRAYHQGLSGVALAETVRELEETVELGDRWSHSSRARSVLVHHVYRLLTESGVEPLAAAVQTTAETLSEVDRASAAPHLMLALCVCGEFEAALTEANRSATLVLDATGSAPAIADFWLFRGLAAAACSSQRSDRRRRRAERALLRVCLARVHHLARRGPDFVHYPTLLEAERARLARRLPRALGLYEIAARRAEQQQHHHHAGLAHERRAELMRNLRRYSAAAHELRKASAFYERWGCVRKVDSLAREARSLL